jgi:hypothetical protein
VATAAAAALLKGKNNKGGADLIADSITALKNRLN